MSAIGPEPQRRRWPAMLGAAATVLMVAGLARELLGHGLAGLTRAAPESPFFYLFFALLYLSGPVADFLIFRRLWGLPIAGLAATLKKRVANELLSYSGEAYFYGWARRRAPWVAAPFGAVKDASVLSALAGNAATLAALALAVPFAGASPGVIGGGVAASAAALVAMSLPFLLWRRRVFSLSRAALWWVFRAQALRVAAGSVLAALAWAAAMPAVGAGTWLLLAGGRLLASRLPLVNKDVAFAGLAVALIGPGEALSDLLAFGAALTLATHAALMAGFALGGPARRAWAVVRRARPSRNNRAPSNRTA